MECKGIREKLCAYFEGAVSSEETRLIEEHLNSCQECRTHLEDLKKTKELVKDLPQVEPPAWLTPKIMFRVRAEDESKRGILRKLFYPLHIKVPIEALAMVFIAVIAVYLFKAVEPDMQLAQLPAPTEPMITGKKAPKPSPKTAADSFASREKASLKEQAEKETDKVSAIPLGSLGDVSKKEDQSALPRPAKEPLTATQKESAIERPGKEIKAAGPLRKQEPAELKQAAQPAPREQESIALSDVAKGTRERKKIAAAQKLKEVTVIKSGPLDITVKVKNGNVATGKVESLLGQLGARKITKKSLEGREVLTAELNALNVKEFLEKLKAIGEVKEKGLPLDISEGDVTIRVELVSNP